MLKKINVLILGKIPPPIGGVTIHVRRLLLKLSLQKKITYSFKEISIIELLKFPFYYKKYDKLHLHSSSPILRFLIAIFCKVFNCKLIITFHGNINRYRSKWLNFLDINTIKLASLPIVLNESSLKVALKYNSNSEKITSFITPLLKEEKISLSVQESIEKLKENTNILFCTNAYNQTFDKNDIEIYGIFEILDFFKNHPNLGLVFSDPSGAYQEKIKNENIILPQNILIITENHSFYKILFLCDVSIRNTSTDGDSLSVKESLYLQKTTFCTNVVSRPKGVILFERGFLKEAILADLKNIKQPVEINIDQATDLLFKIYVS